MFNGHRRFRQIPHESHRGACFHVKYRVDTWFCVQELVFENSTQNWSVDDHQICQTARFWVANRFFAIISPTNFRSWLKRGAGQTYLLSSHCREWMCTKSIKVRIKCSCECLPLSFAFFFPAQLKTSSSIIRNSRKCRTTSPDLVRWFLFHRQLWLH